MSEHEQASHPVEPTPDDTDTEVTRDEATNDDVDDAEDDVEDDVEFEGRGDLDHPVLAAVRDIVAPIAGDLGLDVYDIERRGGTLRVTLDTPAGSEGGITLDSLALASRLIGRQLDEDDPIPGRYTLEVTSPGVERALRTPQHFQREVGKQVAIRLRDVGHDERRVQGVLVSATDRVVTVADRTIPYAQIDRAHTVFEWGPAPKPGKSPGRPGPTRPKEGLS